jgi:hypothetical protein
MNGGSGTELTRQRRATRVTYHVLSAGLLAVVHNFYAAATIAAAETTNTTAMSTIAHV